METVTMNLLPRKASYTVFIENGLFSAAGEKIRLLSKGNKAAIITDSNVAPLYLDLLKEKLGQNGFSVFSYIFPAGESSKNLHTIAEIYDCLAEGGLTRTDCVIALGGGVTGDMAGFAAATFLRGVPFFQIPTSVLAAVDSSIGGKTGFDTKYQKNQIGAFYQPSMVLIDPELFETLPETVYFDGFAEMIKHGAILNPEILSLLEGDYRSYMDKLICENVKVKVSVVEQDEKDTGIRAILNYGHTFGHAAEKLEGYAGITHGSAVAAGMVYAARLGEAMGLTKPGTAKALSTIVKRFHLPDSLSHTPDDLFEAAISDKKNLSGKIGVILLSEFGKAFVNPMPAQELGRAMKEMGN